MPRSLLKVLLPLLAILLGAIAANAEKFSDDRYAYRLDVPEGATVSHFPGKNYNLDLTLPDSSAWIVVYALDVDSVPRDQFASSDDMVFKKSYLADLDRHAFKLGTDCTYDHERTWTNVKERRYKLNDSIEAITNIYMHEERPFVVAAFGKNLDRPEITQTLSSFETRYLPWSGWLTFALFAATFLMGWLSFQMGDSKNTFISIVGIALTIICIIVCVALCVEFEFPFIQRLIYWLT